MYQIVYFSLKYAYVLKYKNKEINTLKNNDNGSSFLRLFTSRTRYLDESTAP